MENESIVDDVVEAMTKQELGLAELFELGGPLMWIILGCSVIATAFLVERLVTLRRGRILPPNIYFGLQKLLEAGDASAAAGLCRDHTSALSRIVRAGLRQRQGGRTAAKEAMEEAGQVEVGRLGRWVGVLSTIAAIAPLLGLLGTVAGMIDVFRTVSKEANPDIGHLAGGIWQALLTTGAGLTVAIVFFVAYRFVESRVDKFGRELEEAGLALLDRMFGTTPSVDARPRPRTKKEPEDVAEAPEDEADEEEDGG